MEEILIGVIGIGLIIVYIVPVMFGIKKGENKIIIKNIIVIDMIFFILYEILKFMIKRMPDTFSYQSPSSITPQRAKLIALTLGFYLAILISVIVSVIGIIINIKKNKKKIQKNP